MGSKIEINDNEIVCTVENNDIHQNATEVLIAVGELIKCKCNRTMITDELTDLSNLVSAYDSLFQSLYK